jgi:hypothetical protein
MSKENLIAYEKEFDELVKQFPLVRMPVRAPLTALHLSIDALFNGSRMKATQAPRPEAGGAAGARLSYIIPLLLDSPCEPTGENAKDAVEATNDADPDGKQRIAMLSYGHFCELMPEVHRCYYSVSGNIESGFTLTHSSSSFSTHEALDIVFNELALTSSLNPPRDLHEREFDRLAETFPLAQGEILGLLLRSFTSHHQEFLNEPPILTEEGYHAALGVGRAEFERFRVALFTVADWCKGMANALERRIRREGYSDAVWAEMLEWISVHWKVDFFIGLVAGCSGLDGAVVERLLAFFTVDFRDGKRSGKHAGDGFLPPIARLTDSVLFNPDLLKLFLPARNVLYALNRTDRKTFDRLVSQHLEPQLIQDACALLSSFEGLELVPNHRWKDGEIDLLVYNPAENAALHVQGKAAIAPQGARMVQSVEGRVEEGIGQLKRLRGLGQAGIDEVLSAALTRQVHNVELIDVMLSRSCLGTDRVWSQLGEIVPLNLALLAGLTNRARREGGSLSLRSFRTTAWSEINRVMQLARPEWVMRSFPAGRTMIWLPMLNLDVDQIWLERRRMWEGESGK